MSFEMKSDTACLVSQNSNYDGHDLLEKGKSLIHLYNKDVVIKRFTTQSKKSGGGLRSEIFEFSEESRNRLLSVCRNSGHQIKSQICLTYHKAKREDGLSVKTDLNIFLTRLRKYYPDIRYIWALEFQASGVPHFHLFTSLEPSYHNRHFLAHLWNVTICDTYKNFLFTSHEKNFFSWDMKSGKYLSKAYISKSVQKDVPEKFHNVGRFWGCSRNMVPRFTILQEHFDIPRSVYKKVVRTVSKARESIIKRYCRISRNGKKQAKKINLRSKHITRKLTSMSSVFYTLLEYYYEQYCGLIYGDYEGVPF